jgi:hypothetical protein
VQKRSEKRRIEDQGKEAIAGKIDGNLIEAVQAVGALEEGREEDYYPIAQADDEGDQRAGKRLRLEDGSASNGAGNGDTSSEAKNGILGGGALENLLYYAELAKKQAEEIKKANKPAVPKTAVGLLGGYGSESEDD